MLKKILLTGAGGRLGSYLREPLTKMANELLSIDIKSEIGSLYDKETFKQIDLQDFSAIKEVSKGVDVIVHFGAIVDEAPFPELLGPNFIGSYNIWEAGYLNNVKRIIYASSIHAVGMYPKNEFIGTEVPHRPDTFYGLAKCFTEDLGKMYFEKCGLESVHLRILSCAKVNNSRALGTWLSYDDLVHLVNRAIDTPVTGFKIVYGVSNNDRSPVDNSSASFLGYRPRDNAEIFAKEILNGTYPENPGSPEVALHGGPFAATNLGESGIGGFGIIDESKTKD